VDSVVSQGIASLTYGDPLIAGADFQYFSDLRFQRLELENQEFNLDRVGFANYLHRSRIVEFEESDLTWSLGHTIFLEDLTDVSPGAIIGEYDTGEVRLGFLSSVVTFDHRDDPLNPVDGYTFQLENQLASKLFGSEASFISLLGRASYLSELSFLSPKWSFAAASRVGSAWTYDDTDQVPISQRYYLGGRTSVRGFGENSLGPRGFDEAIQGGDMTFVQNIELRYLLRSSTQLLGFVDVGGLFLRDRSMLWDDVREAAGLGVRFISPIGPLGLDIGFPLDRRDGEREFRVHFNIGSNF
jgi:outer membrane protein insertion porin family